MTEQVLEGKVVKMRRIKIMPVEDVTGAIRAIVNDWGPVDVLTAPTTPALVLADVCHYAGLDVVEALGPKLAGQLRKKGVLK